MYVLAIRVSTGNHTSGVSLSSHLTRASQLISLHLSSSACKTDNHVGTTQRGLIEVLASPLATEVPWILHLKPSKMLLSDCPLHLPKPPAASAHPWDLLGHLPGPPCWGSEPWEALLKTAVLALLLWMLQLIYFSFLKSWFYWHFFGEKKNKTRERVKEIIQLGMKIMVPLGSRCWIRQEGGELQSSCVGREGVWGVRGSLAKSGQSDVRRARPQRETAPERWWGLPRVVQHRQEQCPSPLGGQTTPEHKTSPQLPQPHSYSWQHYRALLWASRAVKSDPVGCQDENLPIKQLFYGGNCCSHAKSLQEGMSFSGGPGNGDTALFGAGWTNLIWFQLCYQTDSGC